MGGLRISLLKGFALGDEHIGSNTGGDKSPLFNFDTFDSSSLPCCRNDLDDSNLSVGRFIGFTEGRCDGFGTLSACSKLYLRGRPGRRLTGGAILAASESCERTAGCSKQGVGDLQESCKIL